MGRGVVMGEGMRGKGEGDEGGRHRNGGGDEGGRQDIRDGIRSLLIGENRQQGGIMPPPPHCNAVCSLQCTDKTRIGKK